MSDTTLKPSAWHHLARRRDLWWQFTVRAVEMKHRGSYLGIIWTVINPLLMMGLYLFVFGTIFGGSFHALPDETKLDYAFGLFLGLTFFNVLAETISISPILIVTNPNLVKKVVFPLEVLPLSQLGASWFNFLISLSLLLIGAVTFGRGLAPSGLLWLPVIALPHLLLTIGLGWLLSALGVFFRDVQHVVQFAAQVILYASAIFYSPSLMPPHSWYWLILRWNPFLHTVDLARNALLWGLPVNLEHLAYIYVCGAAVFAGGYWFFRKMQPAFADVI
jgi:lipopolysaccharide transport system permease protein